MPSVNDIVDVAESLEKAHVVVLKDNCVAVRNRNTSCRKCLDVCPVDAISIERNNIKLSASRCENCGLCTVACPTEALRAVDPTDIQLMEALDASREANDDVAVVACARMAAKQIADPTRFAEVPCLGRIAAATLLDQAAKGASEIILVDGECGTCKFRYVDSKVNEVVETANELVASQGVGAYTVRESEFPEALLIDDAEGVFGSTRRGFFSDTVKSAKEMAKSAADAAIKKELGGIIDQDLGHRLRASDDGTLPSVEVPRHESLLNSLFTLAEAAAEYENGAALDTDAACCEGAAEQTSYGRADSIDSTLFGAVEIDTARCNACGMCAVFCPTGAIKRDPLRESPTAPLKLLEFTASDCVQCGLCVDVCWKKAIKVRSNVTFDELFDFDPKAFKLR